MRLLAIMSLAVGLAACDALHRGELPTEVGGAWVVQQIAGASLGEGVDIYFEIDADAGAIRGFTGCNRFAAPVTSFGNTLAVGAVRLGPGECASASAATDKARFLGVLPSVQRYVRRGKSLELLPAAGGEALLRLRVDDFVELTQTAPSADGP